MGPAENSSADFGLCPLVRRKAGMGLCPDASAQASRRLGTAAAMPRVWRTSGFALLSAGKQAWDCVLMPRRSRAGGLAPLLPRVWRTGGFALLLPRVRGSVLVLAGTRGLAPLSPPIQGFALTLAGVKGLALLLPFLPLADFAGLQRTPS